jgi:hypothetical protein
MGARGVEVLPLVYDLVVWYARQVPQYPKAFKYTLGERILDTLLDVLERLVEAQYSGKGQKGGSLRRANLSPLLPSPSPPPSQIKKSPLERGVAHGLSRA